MRSKSVKQHRIQPRYVPLPIPATLSAVEYRYFEGDCRRFKVEREAVMLQCPVSIWTTSNTTIWSIPKVKPCLMRVTPTRADMCCTDMEPRCDMGTSVAFELLKDPDDPCP